MRKILLLLLLLLPVSVQAQQGFVTGTALDAVGNTVAGATITVCPQGSPGIPCSPVTASTTSNGQGAFSVGVALGTYTVTVFRSGIVSTSSTIVVAASNITIGSSVTYNGAVTFNNNATVAGNLTVSGTGTLANINNTLYVTSAGSDACAAINTQITALPLVSGFHSGIVDFTALAAASQPVPCGSTVNAGSPFLTLRGPGRGSLTFNCTVTAATGCFNTQEGASFTTAHGFIMSGFTILGQGSGNASAVGLHAGDMVAGKFEDLDIDGFTGTSGSCIWWDNINGFFEDNQFFNVSTGAHGNGIQTGCTKDYRMTNTAGTSNSSSFAHNFILGTHLVVTSGNTGVSFESGAAPNSFWTLTGNIGDTASTNVVSVSGLAFPAGPAASLDGAFFFSVECTSCATPGNLTNIGGSNSITVRAGQITDSAGKLTNTGPLPLYVGADPGGASTGGANLNSPQWLIRGRFAASNSTDQYSLQDVIGSGATPTTTLTLGHTGSSGTTQLDLGSATISNVGLNTLYIGGAPGANNNLQIGHNSGTCAGISGANFGFANSGVAFTVCGDNSGNFGANGGLRTVSSIAPSVAGAADVGTTALPYGNLWLGTAATNNFKFQPAATAAARTITINDPLGNTNLPLTIANGTKALNTASITTATCDAGVAATATGTLSTDAVDWSFNAAPTATNKYGAFLVVYAVPSANTVTFYTCNPSATTSTPTAMTVNFSVRRP